MNLRYAVSVSGLLLLASASAFAQNPPNGNFEAGPAARPQNVPAWTASHTPGTDVYVTAANSSLASPFGGAAIYSGEFTTGLPGDAAGAGAMLTQNVSLPVGQKFITFDYAVLRTDGGNDVFSGRLVDTSGGITSLINLAPASTSGWQRVQVDLSGLAGGSYRLEYALGTNGDRRTTRVGLDNVAIVPAPPALIAFALGAGATSLMGLRRRGRK